MRESCYAFNPLNIITCENAILEFLSWKAIVPTCSDFLNQLLFLANPYQDFTEIIQRSKELIFKALLCYDICIFKSSSVAISCLLCICDELGFQNFACALIELIETEELPFDMEQVLQCKDFLLQLMMHYAGTEENSQESQSKSPEHENPD